MSESEFEQLVQSAILDLPKEIQSMIENVAIVVSDSPDKEQLQKSGVRKNNLLLGLYEGIPQTAWGKGFGGHLPDKITIFQKSIKQISPAQENMKNLVKTVVWHEIAHHFGIGEKQVRKLEQKWNSKF
jgi:predicted Zn-dependent protease with MMP-like domain